MKKTQIIPDLSLFPEPIAGFIDGAEVYDSSSSRQAKVLYIKNKGLYLKEAEAGRLKNEAEMTGYFHRLGLSGEVLFYGTVSGKDWMLTREIPGEDCIDKKYRSDPKRLCRKAASLLRELHRTDFALCPVRDAMDRYRQKVLGGMDGKFYSPDRFRGIWEFSSLEDTKAAAKEGLMLLKSEALIHGDYCLPNLLLNDWEFSGFIDLDLAGIGDRHIDLLQWIWSMHYNLGTWEYTDLFLNEYGIGRAEKETLRVYAAMDMLIE